MSSIPYALANLTLKQINLSQLNKVGQDIFRHLFGTYADITNENGQSHSVLTGMSKEVSEVIGIPEKNIKIEYDRRIPRRYSGDNNLPRGCYFSIAKNSSGNDDYTLLNELKAYANPDKFGLFEIFDLTVPEDRIKVKTLLGNRYKTTKSLLIALKPLYQRPHEIVAGWSGSNTEPIPFTAYVEIPLIIKNIQIEKVIDLRIPSTWEWLMDEMDNMKIEFNGVEHNAFLKRPKLKNIHTLLPSFFEQCVGGTSFSKIIGSHFRKLQANGVIYPSARCDVELNFANNKIKSFKGWNFVDYRNAEKLQMFNYLDILKEWPKYVQYTSEYLQKVQEYKDIRITFINNNSMMNSWKVEGLENRTQSLYILMVIKSILEFEKVSELNFTQLLRLYAQLPNSSDFLYIAYLMLTGITGNLHHLEILNKLNEENIIDKEIKKSINIITNYFINKIITDSKDQNKIIYPISILRAQLNT